MEERYPFGGVRLRLVILLLLLLVSLSLSGFVGVTAADQEIVDTDVPGEVEVDGEFDGSVTVDESQNVLVTVESGDFDAKITSGEGVAEENEVVFLNLGNEEELTHEFTVDISNSVEGDTGTVEINVNDGDDEASFDFEVVGGSGSDDTDDEARTDGSTSEDEAEQDGEAGDDTSEETSTGGDSSGDDEADGGGNLPGFTAVAGVLAILALLYMRNS